MTASIEMWPRLWAGVMLGMGLVLAGAQHAKADTTDTALLMFESAGCAYCVQWHAEVGPEYPITPEGLAAPLIPINISEARNSGYDLVTRPRFTPTFVLVQDGAEVGRIEGYPGEDFFWGLLGRLLDQAAPES